MLLARLAQLDGELLDSDLEGLTRPDVRALARLTKRNHAQKVAPGLYRITLKGLLEHRQNTNT